VQGIFNGACACIMQDPHTTPAALPPPRLGPLLKGLAAMCHMAKHSPVPKPTSTKPFLAPATNSAAAVGLVSGWAGRGDPTPVSTWLGCSGRRCSNSHVPVATMLQQEAACIVSWDQLKSEACRDAALPAGHLA
jgi:hypothetical protein